jgi:hypothetical protein
MSAPFSSTARVVFRGPMERETMRMPGGARRRAEAGEAVLVVGAIRDIAVAAARSRIFDRFKQARTEPHLSDF